MGQSGAFSTIRSTYSFSRDRTSARPDAGESGGLAREPVRSAKKWNCWRARPDASRTSTRSTTSMSSSCSIQRQIWKPAHGICDVRSIIGKTNPSRCLSLSPNTTQEQVEPNAGLERMESLPANSWATSISRSRANTCNRFSIATRFTSAAVECDAYANSAAIFVLS